jgi:hypothetical protein
MIAVPPLAPLTKTEWRARASHPIYSFTLQYLLLTADHQADFDRISPGVAAALSYDHKKF